MSAYRHVRVPSEGERIRVDADGTWHSPDHPIIPFIEGDGTGPDIWHASQMVFDAAVEKTFGGKKKIEWFEVYAGEKAKNKFDSWMPDDTLEAIREYKVAIKGPLTTPVGGGIRSLNVALRQELDLYACVRPVEYFPGVPSPVREPEKVDMVIFRENIEDVYAGLEFAADSMFQQALLRPDEYSVLATPNLNGDYISDALAAQVGGLGIAPGGNIGDKAACFEATHGTAPKYAGQDKVNPGSVILSGVMMLEHLGWKDAAKKIRDGMRAAISKKIVTYDFARQLPGAKEVKCSEFAKAIIENLS